MEIYLFKSIACLAILVVFYKAFLERENMHRFKRFYLLLSIPAALIFPLITFTQYVQSTSASQFFSEMQTQPGNNLLQNAEFNYWPYIIGAIYLGGVLLFSIKFFKNLRHLMLQIKRNDHLKKGEFTWILLSEMINPFTFFSFIFLNKDKLEKHLIPQEVLLHEETHAKELHSLDILLIEILQIVFWFNPLVYVLKDSIKLNHEFLADKAVINHGFLTNAYQKILLQYSSTPMSNNLANSIHYSSIKKRFTVMKTNTSPRALWIKGLLVLPLFVGLLYSFSTKETVIKELEQQEVPVQIMTIENIEILVKNRDEILLNGQKVNLSNFAENLKKIYPEMSKKQRAEGLRAIVSTYGSIEMGILTDIKDALFAYGIEKMEVRVAESPDVERDRQRAEIDRNRAMEAKRKNDPQVEVTAKMVEEYNKLAKYYAALDPDHLTIIFSDVKRMHYIYDHMTAEQLQTAEKFPDFPVPPPPPPAPPLGDMVPPPPPPVSPGNIAPPPPPPNVGIPEPAAPPEPPLPVEHMKKLAKENASFFLNDEEITSAKAIETVRKNKKIQISVITTNEGNTVVQLFTRK